MKIQFSENMWEQISSLWNEKKEESDLDITDEQVKEMLDIWFVSRRAAVSGNKQRYDERNAWKNIESKIMPCRHSKIRFLLKYAAVFVIGLLGVMLCLHYQSDSKMSQVSTVGVKVISSGNSNVELVLADGKKILLDTNIDVKSETLSELKFVNNIGGKKLSYKGDVEDEEVGYHTLNVPQGGEYILQLPDSSCVWLNSESSIRFPVRFAENKREIFLDGEAYFKVAKNEKAPFQLHVKKGVVTVLGTSFNISAYSNDKCWETTLVEGKVLVENGNEKIEMKPSCQYSVDDKTGHGVLKQVDTYLYTSWVDGKFYFNACVFEDIVKKLERWYDFTMTYQDEGIKSMRFSGTINKHRPLNEMLNFLEKTTDIHFEIVGKNITVKRIARNKR